MSDTNPVQIQSKSESFKLRLAAGHWLLATDSLTPTSLRRATFGLSSCRRQPSRSKKREARSKNAETLLCSIPLHQCLQMRTDFTKLLVLIFAGQHKQPYIRSFLQLGDEAATLLSDGCNQASVGIENGLYDFCKPI